MIIANGVFLSSLNHAVSVFSFTLWQSMTDKLSVPVSPQFIDVHDRQTISPCGLSCYGCPWQTNGQFQSRFSLSMSMTDKLSVPVYSQFMAVHGRQIVGSCLLSVYGCPWQTNGPFQSPLSVWMSIEG